MRRLLSRIRFRREAVCVVVLALLLAAMAPMPMAWGGEGVSAGHHCSGTIPQDQNGAGHDHCSVCLVHDQTAWNDGTQAGLPGRNWPLLALVPLRLGQDDPVLSAWFPMGTPRAPPVVA